MLLLVCCMNQYIYGQSSKQEVRHPVDTQYIASKLDESENMIQSALNIGTELSIKNVSPETGYVVSEGTARDISLTNEISTSDYDIDLGNSNRNYILTRAYTEECGADYRINIDYFDGLGRPSGTTLIGASPLGKDIVSRQEYDSYGRIFREWLPRVSEYANGKPVTGTEFEGLSLENYGNDSHPYSKTVYESSLLNRMIEQYGPGAAWHSNDKSRVTVYKTNISGDVMLNAKCYIVGGTRQKPILSLSGNYATGQLYVTELKDEDGNISYEFKDKLGQKVLTRKMAGSMTNDTYYVYDDFGKQCFVLLPRVDDEGYTEAKLDELAFQYKYDDRNRCIAKKLPGCEWIYYIYDKADRLIFSQDGNQRQSGEWLFSIPDVLGRVVLTGTCTNTQVYLSSSLANSIVKGVWNNTTNPMKGYTVAGVSLSNPVVLTVNYYDSYDFLSKNGIPDSTAAAVKYDQEQDEFEKRYMESSQGLLTGTLTAQLTDLVSQSPYLCTVMYYDCHGRLVQTKSTNHLPGGVDKNCYAYNFIGEAIWHKHIHSATGKVTQTNVYNYTFDHAGRLLTTTHQLNEGANVTLVNNEYDELGRLISNKRNGQFNLKTDYTYNIRSQMELIGSPLFSQKLYYTDGIGMPCYNGNISSMKWKASTDPYIRGYCFEYDSLSRLKNAAYGEGEELSLNTNHFNEQITSYDKNGNILGLKRYGQTSASDYGLVDNLTITLNGNQLKSVDDFISGSAFSDNFDFKDGSKQSIEYFYDANGNLIKDLNKNIVDIRYNILNLPDRVEFGDGSYISYLYDASGVKLRTVHNIAGNITTTDYCGNVIYEDGTAKTLLTDAGFVSLHDNKYHFYLHDHQGNNRVVADQDGNIEETNHYYPFGGIFASTSHVQPYKYNGKELDTKNGLDWYDYGARHYDATIGRWHVVDPLTEKHYSISPYVYCGNEPVGRIDPDGRDWRVQTRYNEETKKIEYQMSVNAVLYNGSSNRNINMKALANSITKQINDVYTISDGSFVSTMDFNIKVVNSLDEIGGRDHVFRVVDQGDLDATYPQYASGKVLADANTFGLDIRIGPEATEKLINGSDRRTAAHELGHTGGLHDLPATMEDSDKLMMQGFYVGQFGGKANEALRLPQSSIREIRDNYIQNRINQNSPVKKWFWKKYLSR
ncbi:MAG TPA: RHS repeat-associated core domain-containing protein [Bacteroides reticulotermitis]|nr:RHS repeat-associated core domain-containing protein [Bacteroides reticulotermitis]